MKTGAVRIDVRQLRPGLYVSLADRWLDHPFMFNSFRLSNESQIEIIVSLGITHVDYFPARSTIEPLPLAPQPRAPVPAPGPDAAQLAELEEKRRRMERVAERRAQLAASERAYSRAASDVKILMANLFARSETVQEQAGALVEQFVDELMARPDAMLNLMSDAASDGNAYYHALNVMILSLMLGQAEELSEREMRALGLGALFHDLGKAPIPDAILRKDASERNRHETELYRLHPEYGTQMARDLGVLPPVAIHIVRHHHECLDGSGFPDGLTGTQIPRLTRIVAIVNRYDNLCNHPDPARSLSPGEALARMYRYESEQLDSLLLQRFIKSMGIYPPGSVVQLSNGAIGLVVSFDREDALRPSVMLYDPDIPKAEALIVDLRDAQDVKVERVLRPAELEPAVVTYLAPRKRVTYFYGRGGSTAV